MKPSKILPLIENLTRADALAYSQETDKLMWIETHLLDPANLPRSLAEVVEDALLKLLEIEYSIQRGELVRIEIPLREIRNYFVCGRGDEEFDYVCHAVAFIIAMKFNAVEWTRFCSDNLTHQFRKQWSKKITEQIEYIECEFVEPTFSNNNFLESWVLNTKYQRPSNVSHHQFRVNTLEDATYDFPDLEFEFIVDPKGY